jgi:putative transposase
VDWENRELPVRTQAELLSLNRSGLYYQPVPPSAEEVAFKHRIDEIYTAHGYYGSGRIAAQLHREGQPINQKTVARSMQEMGLAAVYRGPNLSRRAHQAGIFPYLLANVKATTPNHIWGIDRTSIRPAWVAGCTWWRSWIGTPETLVSWELDQSMQIAFVIEAVQRALSQARPQICNSDQGSQFSSPQYTQVPLAHEVRISMDGRGRALDNIFTERLWRTIKQEEGYLNDYATPREARQGLSAYLRFYNEERIHQSLDYHTPAEVYFAQ